MIVVACVQRTRFSARRRGWRTAGSGHGAAGGSSGTAATPITSSSAINIRPVSGAPGIHQPPSASVSIHIHAYTVIYSTHIARFSLAMHYSIYALFKKLFYLAKRLLSLTSSATSLVQRENRKRMKKVERKSNGILQALFFFLLLFLEKVLYWSSNSVVSMFCKVLKSFKNRTIHFKVLPLNKTKKYVSPCHRRKVCKVLSFPGLTLIMNFRCIKLCPTPL